MIPKKTIVEIVERKEQGNDSFFIDENKKKLRNKALDIEALKQSINKILNTHRYSHIIYSWNYGIEINDLFGKNYRYVSAKLENRIKEALMQDDRILSVEDFKTKKGENRNELIAEFVVNTIYGKIDAKKEVKY